ncbi:MAG: 2-oxo acid dehydrogenase subunit E2 [Bacteroidales bacterium]|nr:2-oxo acid dehydrogenase subunit E2 [Bacteroidales bacterium]
MFGLRPDGKRLKGIDPIQKIVPHIMNHRYDAQNMNHYDCRCEPIDDFIKEEQEKGVSFRYMHIMMAGLVRIIATYPRLNRFVINGRIFKRNSINISFVVKKGLSATASDSLIKLEFTGHESIYEVKEKIDKAVLENAHLDANNGTDKLARVLTFTPNCVIKLLVGTIKLLDKHGMLPKFIIDLSPFHTSAFITNLKSIKGPSVFHHLYDFGTTGIFFSMGKESLEPVVEKGQIVVGKVMPVDIVLDERFCDGFYFVNALNVLKKMYANPSCLRDRLEELPEDVEVDNAGSHKARKNK